MNHTFVPYRDSLKAQWDAFVDAHPQAWAGHNSAIIDFERTLGHSSFSHLALDGRGTVIAIAPMFLQVDRQLRLFRRGTLSSGTSLRGAPLTAPGLSPKQLRAFWLAWSGWIGQLARHERIDQIRVAFPHIMGDRLNTAVHDYYPLRDHGFTANSSLTQIIDLSQAPRDLLQMVDKDCRNRIRRAIGMNPTFTSVEDRQAWMDCHPLNLETFEGQAEPPYSRQSMAAIWDGFVSSGRAHVFALDHEGDRICVVATIGTEHSQYYWISFSRRPPPWAGANNLLLYRVLESMRDRGVRYFEMGSIEFGDSRQRRISHYKRSFGGEIRHSMDGHKNFSTRKLATLGWLETMLGR